MTRSELNIIRRAGLTAAIAAAGLMAGAALAQTDSPTGTPDSLRENFNDWLVNCESTPADAATNPGQRICELVQQLDDQGSGQRVLAFSLRINDAGDPIAVLVAPFGLRLSEGLRVQIGEELLGHFAFDTCLPSGCLAIAPMEPGLITAMQNGTDARVTMVSRQGEAVGVPISLIGFTAGLARLRALSGD